MELGSCVRAQSTIVISAVHQRSVLLRASFSPHSHTFLPLTFTPHSLSQVGVPNGIPLVYKFDRNIKPIKHKNAGYPLSGIWLGKKVHVVYVL